MSLESVTTAASSCLCRDTQRTSDLWRLAPKGRHGQGGKPLRHPGVPSRPCEFHPVQALREAAQLARGEEDQGNGGPDAEPTQEPVLKFRNYAVKDAEKIEFQKASAAASGDGSPPWRMPAAWAGPS
jgi:hypothetical protein